MNKYKVVKEVIDNWDSINLLSHAPEDEYGPEIKAYTFMEAKSREELASIIHSVFVKFFGEDSDLKSYTLEKCHPVANEMWNIYG